MVEVDFQESLQSSLIEDYNSAYQCISKFNFTLSEINNRMSGLIDGYGADLIDDALDHYNQAHALQDLADKCGQLLGQISYIKTLSDSGLDLDQETFPFVSNFTGGKNE